MAQKECTGTASVVFICQAQSGLTAYIWCTRQDIQAYLDDESTITIGSANDSNTNFDESTAKRLENHLVLDVVEYLSAVYNIDTASSADVLIALVARLTAAQIGFGRFAASIGNEPSHWTIRLENKVWAALQRIFINQTLEGTGISKKNVPMWQRIIMAKTRERSIVPNV